MQRIYLPHSDFGATLSLENGDIYSQLIKVLRFQVGDTCGFFDGETSSDFVYQLQEIHKKVLIFSLLGETPRYAELSFELELYQAFPNKLEKLEYIVQKCCEVGFRRVVFFPSERSQKLSLTHNKKERLQKIMIEAIEQCGRSKLCEIDFQQKVAFSHIGDSVLVFHQERDTGSSHIRDVEVGATKKISILVGPEGGFTQNEMEIFESEKYQKIYLGERILRCETAGAVTGFFLGQYL